MSVLLLAPSSLEAQRFADACARAGVTARTIGVGPVAAALGTAALLHAARRATPAPRIALLVGLAGSHDIHRAPLGQLIIGTRVVDEAVGAGSGAAFLPLERLGLPAQDSTPHVLPLVFEPLCAALPEALSGELTCVATIAARREQAAIRQSRRPAALAEEMEGHAVALACLRAGVPLAILRVISNAVGERDKRQWDIDGACAQLASALPRAVAALAESVR